MKLFVWKDKHGDVYYKAETIEDRKAAVLDILRVRLDNGYFEDEDDGMIREIIFNEDYRAALNLLYERRSFEYEGFKEAHTEDV